MRFTVVVGQQAADFQSVTVGFVDDLDMSSHVNPFFCFVFGYSTYLRLIQEVLMLVKYSLRKRGVTLRAAPGVYFRFGLTGTLLDIVDVALHVLEGRVDIELATGAVTGDHLYPFPLFNQ